MKCTESWDDLTIQMRESDVTAAAVSYAMRQFEKQGADRSIIAKGERRCRLAAPEGSRRGQRQGRPDGLVIARLEGVTFVLTIESKSCSGIRTLAPYVDPPGLAPGLRSANAMDQAAAYPGDHRVLAVASEAFEHSPEFEQPVAESCARLGIGLWQVHGLDWVEELVRPRRFLPMPPHDDWLGHFMTEAFLRQAIAGAP